jgi:VWFA-related protein
MKFRSGYPLALTLIISPMLSISGQTPARSGQQTNQQPGQQGEQKIRISSAEVVLDVVAKDKKGRPVTDLTSQDFEVFEEGVKQPIESFKLITRGAAGKTVNTVDENPVDTTKTAEPAASRIDRRSDPEVGVSVVALVFDRLSPDARKRANDSAMSYVDDNAGLSSFVGVFAVNLNLYTLQNYTTDVGLVKKAIEKAGSLASSSFDSSTTRSGMAENQAARQAVMGAAASAASGAGAAGGGAAAAAAGAAAAIAGIDQQFEVMQERSRETFEVLQRDQQGYATTNGLMALVSAMQRLPGRKAVIFFSEGMALPPNVQQHFRSVINSANRANVSVYTVDAAGLRTESPLQEARNQINSRSRQRMDTLDEALRSPDALTKGLERNEDFLNYNPQNGLVWLATETGGAFIGDTNNIGPKLKQIDEELNTFYLMTYSPINQNYDGKFRNISVKVKRGGVELQSRKGYFAVPPTGNSPLFYYEALPLAALNKSPQPKDFSILVASLNFPESDRPGRTAIEIEASTGDFTFAPDNEKKVYTTDFSFVVLIKDPSKQVVDKLSHHYVLLGPLNSIESTKKGKILFYRETNLPPGKYSVEAVAYDALNNKASINKSSVEILAADNRQLRLSSVTIIKRIGQVKEKMDSPFLVGKELLVYPNLGEPVSKSAKQMGFYFNVYPATGSKDALKLTLEVLQGGKSLANVPLKLAAPDENGRIQYASALPLDSLAPGNYELRISVSDSKGSVSRSASFILEP